MRKTGYLCLTTVVLAATVLAQSISTTQGQQDDKVVVGANLVTLNVIVTDSKGRYVKGLARDQFEVYDNKVKQPIAHFSTDASPVSIGIVCEIHESAIEKTRAMLAAIKEFTTTLENEDDFFFLAFNEHGSFVTDFVPSSDQVLDHLRFVKPGGPSSLYDSIYLAADRLKKSRNLKKTLLVISDGQDTSSIHNYNKLRYRLRTLDAQLYAIGIADPKNYDCFMASVNKIPTSAFPADIFKLNLDAARNRGLLLNSHQSTCECSLPLSALDAFLLSSAINGLDSIRLT